MLSCLVCLFDLAISVCPFGLFELFHVCSQMIYINYLNFIFLVNYLPVEFPMNYTDAEEYCEGNALRLAVLRTSEDVSLATNAILR